MIRLELAELPPSSNHAYANMRGGGGRVLTKVGRAFLEGTKVYLTQKYRQEMMFFKPNHPYLVVVRFHVENLENVGFPKKTDTRYKKLDGGNRLKLLEDALKDAGGIDDSQTLVSLWEKCLGKPEKTLLWIWDLEEEETPFDGILRSLR